MAHVEKYHAGAMGHLFKHFERAVDDDGNYIKFKNQSIDLTKTKGNYNLATFQPLPQLDFIHKRLSEVKVFKRADVKVLCSWVVTLPKSMKTDEQLFFEEVVKFLTKKYKKENVISAYVHKDETQPHLHFAFIPITVDKKKGIEKVSAKEVLTRNELQHFHTDLDNYLTNVFGKNTGVLNEATKDGNQSIEDLKRGTAVIAVKEKQEELKSIENKVNGLKWANKIEVVKEKKDCVIISKTDYESAKIALIKKYLLETRTKEAETKSIVAENERKKAIDCNYEKEITDLKSKIHSLQNEQNAVLSDNIKMDVELDKIYKVLDENPHLKKQLLSLTNEIEQMQL